MARRNAPPTDMAKHAPTADKLLRVEARSGEGRTLDEAGMVGARLREPSREHGFHALRHPYASEELEAGASVDALARWPGTQAPGSRCGSIAAADMEPAPSCGRPRKGESLARCSSRRPPGRPGVPKPLAVPPAAARAALNSSGEPERDRRPGNRGLPPAAAATPCRSRQSTGGIRKSTFLSRLASGHGKEERALAQRRAPRSSGIRKGLGHAPCQRCSAVGT